MARVALTLGPLFFHWPAERLRNFYFRIADEAPVTYSELFTSAEALNRKLFNAPPGPEAEDTVDLGPLKYVAQPSP